MQSDKADALEPKRKIAVTIEMNHESIANLAAVALSPTCMLCIELEALKSGPSDASHHFDSGSAAYRPNARGSFRTENGLL